MADVTNVNPDPTVENVENTHAPEQPLILGKFKTQDDLIKAYTELEKKLSSKPVVEPIPTEEFDLDFIGAEYAETGEVSQESMDKAVTTLRKAGIKKEKAEQYINEYIKGIDAYNQISRMEAEKLVVDTVGSIEQYQSLIQWAQANLSEEEIGAYNKAVNTGVPTAKLAMEALLNKYQKANGNPPAKLLSGDGPALPTTGKFNTWDEYLKARKNPKYNTDPNYKATVERMLLQSDLS
jgi:hypothetical protein